MPATDVPIYETYAPGSVFGEIGRGQLIEEYVDDMIDAGLVHTIHVSERRAFRSCRQRWQWAYQEDLHGTDSIRALEFGQAYHHAMEKFYDPTTWHLDKLVLAEFAVAEYSRFTTETFRKFVKQGVADERLIQDFEERITSGEAMLRHYFTEIAPVTDTFEPVAVEIAFEVPLMDPEGNYILCKCERCWQRWRSSELGKADYLSDSWSTPNEYLDQWLGLPVTIGGRLDALVKDLETGKMMVLDWKTTAAIMNENELTFLELDDQISTYLLAMHKLGVAARDFIYHEERKAAPEPPEPLTKPYRGRLYQASKTLPTSYPIYLETISEGDPGGLAAGAYDEYLKWLQEEGPKFYQRTIVTRNDDQLRAAEGHIWLEYLDMISGRVYPNPSRKQCSWCNFFDPCLTKQQGGRYDHTLRSMYVKGGRELSNDKNQPDPLPKREPGKEAEKVDRETKEAGATPRRDAQ